MQLTSIARDHYLPGSGLLAAINTALFLRRPLLLSGDPGTGKTECAQFVARQLAHHYPEQFRSNQAYRFDTKSVSQSTDLFYTYDAVAHFGDKTDPPPGKEHFISFNTLGMALLGTRPVRDDLRSFANYNTLMDGKDPSGAVVLIDEIDKAPRDFPNDLLAELEKPPFRFSIKELPGFTVEQDKNLPVVIIITSNNEKGLPDAFLRRCVFHHINFPGEAELQQIVNTSLQLKGVDITPAISLFMEIRNKANVAKPPATSELIDWIACLYSNGLLNSSLAAWERADAAYRSKLIDTLGVIAKTKTDFETLKKKIEG